MKKMIFAAVILILLAGCDRDIRLALTSQQPSTKKEDMKTICLDGVTYYYFTKHFPFNSGVGFMSVKFNRDGTVNTCDDGGASIPIPLAGK